MKNFSNKKSKVNKTQGFPLVFFILILMIFFFVPVFSSKNNLYKNFESRNFNQDQYISKCVGFWSSTGNSTILVYLLYSQKIHQSILFIDGLGRGVLVAYEFVGRALNEAFAKTTDYYFSFFQNNFTLRPVSWNIDKEIKSYSANVSGGLSIVKEDFGGRIKELNGYVLRVLSLGREILN